ncbi:hypothetical protein BDF22DRAFT_691282 [Syncephalis plumigaleata]|nr:hypothetical protein BDF22DRAFT_691282 [Syncephalis plumigaleata]
MKVLFFTTATASLAVSLTWFTLMNVVFAQPQERIVPSILPSPTIPPFISIPTITKTVSVASRPDTTSAESPPIKTTLAVPPASWRGVCAGAPTDNLRYIVTAKNGTMQTVLLVEKSVYDQIATGPGHLVAGRTVERWAPLSCKDRALESCANDSSLDKGASPLAKMRWCIITSNPARATRPIMVEFNVGWHANEGPDVTSAVASTTNEPKEEDIPQSVNSGVDRMIGGQPFYLAFSTCIFIISALIAQ